MTTATARKVTGLNHVFVNTKRPTPNHVVQVFEGEGLPTDLQDGEVDRLDKLGAFGVHPRTVRDTAISRLSAESGGLPITQADLEAMMFALDKATAPEPE